MTRKETPSGHMMGKMPRITGNFTEQTLNAKTARTDVFQA
jgi:hypothetical protein